MGPVKTPTVPRHASTIKQNRVRHSTRKGSGGTESAGTTQPQDAAEGRRDRHRDKPRGKKPEHSLTRKAFQIEHK